MQVLVEYDQAIDPYKLQCDTLAAPPPPDPRARFWGPKIEHFGPYLIFP